MISSPATCISSQSYTINLRHKHNHHSLQKKLDVSQIWNGRLVVLEVCINCRFRSGSKRGAAVLGAGTFSLCILAICNLTFLYWRLVWYWCLIRWFCAYLVSIILSLIKCSLVYFGHLTSTTGPKYVNESDSYGRTERIGKCSGQKRMICLNLIRISEHIKINAILHPSLVSLPRHWCIWFDTANHKDTM